MTRTTDRRPPVIEGELIERQVTRAVRTLPIVPRAPEAGWLDAFFGNAPTLEDHAEYFRQRADVDRAFVGALDARETVLRTMHKLGQLPVAFKRDDEIRALEFEYQCEQIRCAISRVKSESRRADVSTARFDSEIARYQQEAGEQSLERESSAFADELKAKQRTRRERDEAIAGVRRSRSSAAEKEAEINEINAMYERTRMEE